MVEARARAPLLQGVPLQGDRPLAGGPPEVPPADVAEAADQQVVLPVAVLPLEELLEEQQGRLVPPRVAASRFLLRR